MARYVFFSDAPFLVGYALYFYTYSTWDGRVLYMEDLYVKPEFRGNKIGTQLWKAVTKVTNTIWYVYVYFSTNSRKMNTEKCAVSGYGYLMQVLTVY